MPPAMDTARIVDWLGSPMASISEEGEREKETFVSVLTLMFPLNEFLWPNQNPQEIYSGMRSAKDKKDDNNSNNNNSNITIL